MSGKNREDVWLVYCGKVSTAVCYCCQNKNSLMRRHDAKSWHIGHILGEKYDGAKSMMNVRPLCTTCNNSSKEHVTTYGYMAEIGTLSIQDALDKESKHIKMIQNNLGSNLKGVYHCIAITQKGTRCTFNKCKLNLCCKVHIDNEKYHINVYIKESQATWRKLAAVLDKIELD
jgi:hypothetical protein